MRAADLLQWEARFWPVAVAAAELGMPKPKIRQREPTRPPESSLSPLKTCLSLVSLHPRAHACLSSTRLRDASKAAVLSARWTEGSTCWSESTERKLDCGPHTRPHVRKCHNGRHRSLLPPVKGRILRNGLRGDCSALFARADSATSRKYRCKPRPGAPCRRIRYGCVPH